MILNDLFDIHVIITKFIYLFFPICLLIMNQIIFALIFSLAETLHVN